MDLGFHRNKINTGQATDRSLDQNHNGISSDIVIYMYKDSSGQMNEYTRMLFKIIFFDQ